MTEASERAESDYIALTADIVSAYVGNNAVGASDLAGLISSVHGALTGTTAPKVEEPIKAEPAVPIKKSVTPDHIISLETGQKFKSLKRHLTTRGMTEAEYRSKWNLPKDYPMVAPNYSAQRSSLAKSLGLGRGGRKSEEAVAEPVAETKATRRKKAA